MKKYGKKHQAGAGSHRTQGSTSGPSAGVESGLASVEGFKAGVGVKTGEKTQRAMPVPRSDISA